MPGAPMDGEPQSKQPPTDRDPVADQREHALGALWEMAAASRYDVAVLSTNPDAIPSSRLREVSGAAWMHLKGAAGIITARKSDAIVLTKFKTPLLPLLMLLTFPWAKQVFMVVHHTIQQAFGSAWPRPVLWLAARLGYGLLVFESTEALRCAPLDSIGLRRVIEIPEPGPHSSWWDTEPIPQGVRDPAIVGVVGERRAEKGTDALICELKAIQQRGDAAIDILVAARNLHEYPGELLEGVLTMETSDMSSYCEALRRCDIVAINHSEDRYRHRTSGVLADAIVFGCHVVAPDYPVFRYQLTTPTRVGATFTSLAGVGAAIASVLDARGGKADPFTPQRQRRLPAGMAAEFDAQLESLL